MFKRFGAVICVSIVVILFFCTVSKGKTALAASDVKEEIMKISDERERALETGDVAALDRIDADDIVYSNWRGVTMTKAQHLAEIKSKELTVRTMKHTDVQIVVHGNTGIVSGTSATSVVYKGNSPVGTRRFVNVFAKENGRWQCVVHFEAPVMQ
jgi:ketosteroid isomerase-like protein